MNNKAISDVLSLLKNPRKSGTGYTARCPAHDDRRNSLSVSVSNEGGILVYCHAGCSFSDIAPHLNLFAEPAPKPKKREPSAVYDYTDERGRLLFQTLRYEPKDFRQRRPGSNGRLIYNLNGVKLVPYRLPELLQAPFVYICEGEKDVEALRRQGETATCNPMGAGKWRPEFNKYFKGKTVVILPDNDEPGRSHASKVAQSLFGIAKEVFVVNLPGLPEKGDVSKFFENGGTIDDLIELVRLASPWSPGDLVLELPRKSKFEFTPIAQLLTEPPEETGYVWDKTLPVGGISIMSAKPKVGKSTVARNLAVCIARGEPFLGRNTTPGRVLYLCLEEKRSEVRGHFERMDVSTEDILVFTGRTPADPIPELKLAVQEYKPRLVIIDPLSRILKVPDFNDYGPMSRAMEPLIDLARDTDGHILMAHHDSKADRTGGEAVLGSTALFGAVDCHIQLKKDDNGRTLQSIQRYGEDLPSTVIELDKEVGLITAKGVKKDLAEDKIRTEILTVVHPGEKLRASDIKDRLKNYPGGAISAALQSLVSEGLLFRTGDGKRGNPFLYQKP